MATFTDSTGRAWAWVERTPGSPEEAFAQDRSSAQKIIDITDWTNRFLFCREWIGYSLVLTGVGGKPYISRVEPQFDPACADLALNQFLWADEVVRIEGVAPKAPWKSTVTVVPVGDPEPVYTKARITFRYTSRLYDILPDRLCPLDPNGNPDEAAGVRYLIREFKPTTEYFSMPQAASGSGFQWVGTHTNGGQLVSQSLGKIIGKTNCVFTWINVPAAAVPTKLVQGVIGGPAGSLALDKAIGRVNKDVFLGMPIGTFLLQSFDIKPQVSAFGDRQYQVQLLGQYFEPTTGRGHNYFFDPRNPTVGPNSDGWDEATTNGTTNIGTYADGKNVFNWANMQPCLRCAGA